MAVRAGLREIRYHGARSEPYRNRSCRLKQARRLANRPKIASAALPGREYEILLVRRPGAAFGRIVRPFGKKRMQMSAVQRHFPQHRGIPRLQCEANGAAVGRPLWVMYDAVDDRKSTRLNSSHLGISYAVFCLK